MVTEIDRKSKSLPKPIHMSASAISPKRYTVGRYRLVDHHQFQACSHQSTSFFLPGIVDEQPGLESRDRCRHVFALCSGHGFFSCKYFCWGCGVGAKRHWKMFMSFWSFEGCLYVPLFHPQERSRALWKRGLGEKVVYVCIPICSTIIIHNCGRGMDTVHWKVFFFPWQAVAECTNLVPQLRLLVDSMAVMNLDILKHPECHHTSWLLMVQKSFQPI